MRRFWRSAFAAADGGILLDGKAVRTPGGLALRLPTPSLAHAVADEWNAVGESLDPRAMPLTGLANAAIERVAADPGAFAAGLARYGETDLLCYRADPGTPLAERQAAAWDPPLAWVRRRYDIHLEPVAGIVHHAQPSEAIARLGAAVAALPPFALAPLSSIVTLTGSLVLALMLADAATDAETAWAAAHIDEDWQAELWGTDPEGAAVRSRRRSEFDAAVRFLELARSGELADEADQPRLA